MDSIFPKIIRYDVYLTLLAVVSSTAISPTFFHFFIIQHIFPQSDSPVK